MKSTVSLQIDTDTLLRLISQLKLRGGTQDLSEVVTSAIELWLREQSKLAAGNDPASVRGYQWKTLFLPDGTELRSWSYGEYNYARVVGDEIIHKGRSVSPNQFAQAFARSFRNAWMDLYIKRPEDKQFKNAGRLRQELAEQAARPVVAMPAAPDTPITALLAALQQKLQAPPPPAEPPPRPRDTTPGEGWTSPERRKFRFRLEDVAFE
ncbi:hypothetical protein HH213_16925 [Duganella dendranthematis]|uniref:Uncharacterized protein n=1 Tax=Duganella dendranthematis TaxID=2728021 RepID=A0ABX6MC10_9BURK|nr:hypothetical protein [Duganella dendranthematis]QJD91620.1 hypothetical protein HH213_16925 [Duganella dendranthematis]